MMDYINTDKDAQTKSDNMDINVLIQNVSESGRGREEE
jgi:hypothetical protein